MDIYCPQCAEPWETDVLHEIAEEHGITWDKARKLFRKDGCAALGTTHNGNKANPIVGEILDLLGDDIDGAASMFEDFYQEFA